jgi:hypothetical protein
MARTEEMPDRVCIRDFAKFLEAIGKRVSGVDGWPEDRAQGEIDAIIGPYALQHTSVDTLPDGRRRGNWFRQVIGTLEDEFRGRLGFYLSIVFDWSCIQKGQNWGDTNQALRRWIVRDAVVLADGRHKISSAQGIPFAFHVSKGGPLKLDGVYFARWDPKDQTLSERLRDQLVGRHDKLTVLAKYRSQGKKTLLLLESSDVALMSDGTMGEAFLCAFPEWPSELDELWFVHHMAPPTMNIHDLRRGQTWLFDPSQRRLLVTNEYTARVT